MKEPKSNTPDIPSKKATPKELTKKLFEKRIEGFDTHKQALLLKLYNEIIEEKK